MNRRSLILGSVIAATAGVLGVKAEPLPEPDYHSAGRAMQWLDKQHPENNPTLTLKDLQDAAALLMPDVRQSQRAFREMQADIYLNGEGFQLVTRQIIDADLFGYGEVIGDGIRRSPEYQQLLRNRIREYLGAVI